MRDADSSRQFTILVLLAVIVGAYAPLSYADDNVATMARIVLSLQHVPSDADKATLAAIANGDSSGSEKTVANAIAGIQHKVSADDKAALDAIAEDASEPADLRELASIVAGINHMPSDEAKAALEKLAAS